MAADEDNPIEIANIRGGLLALRNAFDKAASCRPRAGSGGPWAVFVATSGAVENAGLQTDLARRRSTDYRGPPSLKSANRRPYSAPVMLRRSIGGMSR
jgi:hypothetical protein